MISFIPHSALGTPHSKRRGGTYIIVVGSALVVSSLGMMAILQQRVQRKGFEAAADMEQARLNAESAVRLGLLQMARDPNWRSAAAANGGAVLTLTSADFGNVVLEALDPHDADLTDDADDAVVLRAKQDKAAAPTAGATSAAPTLSWEEQKKRNNRKKQLPGQRDEALAAIERAEQRKAAIAAMWCEPGFYERTSKEDVAALEREERALGPQIEELLAKWEALEAELASLEAG